MIAICYRYGKKNFFHLKIKTILSDEIIHYEQINFILNLGKILITFYRCYEKSKGISDDCINVQCWWNRYDNNDNNYTFRYGEYIYISS